MWHFIWVIIVIKAKLNDAFYGTLWEKILFFLIIDTLGEDYL